ncbi:MAG: glycoside hydrolase family 3 N-terminal domain-containing protein [Balneolaceae bacterium]
MKQLNPSLPILLLAAALAFLSDPPSSDPETVVPDPLPDLEQPLAEVRSAEDVQLLFDGKDPWVEEKISSMNLSEKVGQMISPRINAHYLSRDSDAYQEMISFIKDLRVGGITFFSGDVHELALLINDFQKHAETPLLISADFERGTAMRVRRATSFPPAMALGAAGDEHLAYRQGLATALEGRALGVHQNFAPIADINSNPDNPVINVRSFGENPEQVGILASAFLRGLHDGGMLSTGKHFPGHGDTDIDSHLSLPQITKTREQLDHTELTPFRQIIRSGVTAIMTAHIALPELTGDPQLPATHSQQILTDLLRNELGFEGLIVTDALDMYGIDHFHSREEAAIRAVEAGADLLLLPPDPHTAVDAIVSAVRLGEISENRIDQSVRRILSAKRAVGLHQQANSIDLNHIRETVGHAHHRDLAETIARRSITLVRNEKQLFPLRATAGRRILLITIRDEEDQRTAIHRYSSPHTSEPAGTYFTSRFREYHPLFEQRLLDPRSNRQEVDDLITAAKTADLILVHSYAIARSGGGDLTLPDHMEEALKQLDDLDKPLGVLSFGDPYFIRYTPDADAYLTAWSSSEVSVSAAVETIVGRNSPTGTLPITIPDIAPAGKGIHW